MNREDELIRKAIRTGMPNKETVLNHCILALEKEEKENASMKAGKFIPRKFAVVVCVVVCIMASSTICYAATGQFPLKLIINGQEQDVDAYLKDDNTIHIEDQEKGVTQEITVDPESNALLDIEEEGTTIEFYDDEPGSVSIEEKSMTEK